MGFDFKSTELKLFLMVANPIVSPLLHPFELVYKLTSSGDFFFSSVSTPPLPPSVSPFYLSTP